jgi:hypothetical protein
MRQRLIISLHKDVREKADQLAEKKYVTLSGLITQLILAEDEKVSKVIPSGTTKPVGRPRHTGAEKQITRWIERAERFPAYWREELAGTEGLFDGMFGALQAKLDKGIEERDGPTLEALAQGHEWEEVREAYWKKVEEEDRNA